MVRCTWFLQWPLGFWKSDDIHWFYSLWMNGPVFGMHLVHRGCVSQSCFVLRDPTWCERNIYLQREMINDGFPSLNLNKVCIVCFDNLVRHLCFYDKPMFYCWALTCCVWVCHTLCVVSLYIVGLGMWSGFFRLITGKMSSPQHPDASLLQPSKKIHMHTEAFNVSPQAYLICQTTYLMRKFFLMSLISSKDIRWWICLSIMTSDKWIILHTRPC